MFEIIAALIALFGVLYGIYRNTKQKNIEAERAKWREKIRKLSSNIACNPNSKDITELTLRLNPLDKLDKEIIDSAENLIRNYNYFAKKRFLNRVAKLLKHDWERAKLETQLFGFLKKTTAIRETTRADEYSTFKCTKYNFA